MNDIEVLRKEVNELRERVAILERIASRVLVSPLPKPDPYAPPFIVTCHTGAQPL